MNSAEPPRRSTADPIYLQPGQFFVGSGCRIRTLLGSCVSITLWQPQRRVGAMSHFLLWSRQRPSAQLDGRYGDEVLPLMLQDLAALGVQPGDCQAKLFGGGDMFPCLASGAAGVGQRNGIAARLQLQQRGIRLVDESLFGVGHREIDFDLHSGQVQVRQVRPDRTAAPGCQAPGTPGRPGRVELAR